MSLVPLCVVAACLEPRGVGELPPLDAPVALVVHDATGAAHPAESIPRRPRLELSLALDVADTQVLLVPGAVDAALVADLRSPPWSADTLARALPLVAEVTRSTTTLRPLSPLPPGSGWVLVVPPWARTRGGGFVGASVAQPLVVRGEAAGATLLESFPPAGALGLPTNLRAVDLSFDDALGEFDAVDVVRAAGTTSARVASVECASVGLRGHRCARVTPPTLAPDEAFTLVAHPLDRFGDPVPVELRFATGSTADDPPVGVAWACAPDEQAWFGGCLLALDDRFELRARFAGPTRLRLVTGGAERMDITRYGAVALSIGPLVPDTELAWSVTAEGTSGAARLESGSLRTAPARPAVVIQEVRPNPIGREPTQESVLMCARGTEALGLGGATLTDDPARAGDRLPDGVVLPPGGCVLVVADDFDPSAPFDLPPPPGLPLLRVGASIGSGGLSNAGEPLIVRGPDGARWAWAPALAVPDEGRCLVRADVPADVDAPYSVGPCRHGLP